MCYVLLLSTTSDTDLTACNSDLVRFSSGLPEGPTAGRLEHPHRWYVGSKSGCSCTFRHLHSVELGFGEPLDWYPEGADEVAATLELAALIRRLVDAGESVDCIDVWQGDGAAPEIVERLEVDLAGVADAALRLFENHHFRFVSRSRAAEPTARS